MITFAHVPLMLNVSNEKQMLQITNVGIKVCAGTYGKCDQFLCLNSSLTYKISSAIIFAIYALEYTQNVRKVWNQCEF
jgi:uncharacterized membrane-anchored protein